MMWLFELEIPDFRTVACYTPISTNPQYCKRWYDEFVNNTRVLYQTCIQVWPAYLATIRKLEHSREKDKTYHGSGNPSSGT